MQLQCRARLCKPCYTLAFLYTDPDSDMATDVRYRLKVVKAVGG